MYSILNIGLFFVYVVIVLGVGYVVFLKKRSSIVGNERLYIVSVLYIVWICFVVGDVVSYCVYCVLCVFLVIVLF